MLDDEFVILDNMSEVPPTSIAIRSELVDIATEFLKNPKISNEKMERKREFLQKKGLTDAEINYAFQLIPQQETTKPKISNQQSSFLHRLLSNLTFAGFLVFAIQILKQLFRSNQSKQKFELNETIKNLQKSVQHMQTSIVKLEQTADQLNLTNQSSSSIEQIKQEIQILKGLFLGRSQIPTRQSKISETIPTNQTTSDSDNDGIIVISEQ